MYTLIYFKFAKTNRMLRLEEIMTEKKITAKELASLSHISPVTISNILTGKSSPRVETVQKFAEVLDVDIRELFVPTKEAEWRSIYIKEGESFTPIGEIKKGSV